MDENTCTAIKDRARLTAQIRIAAVPHVGLEDIIDESGTEEALLEAMSVLQGIVNEYQDGGDQMVETCSCGKHVPDQEVTFTIPYNLTTVELKLDPAAKDPVDVQKLLSWLRDTSTDFEEEMARIILSTAILNQANAGTFEQCFKTAVIWERG